MNGQTVQLDRSNWTVWTGSPQSRGGLSRALDSAGTTPFNGVTGSRDTSLAWSLDSDANLERSVCMQFILVELRDAARWSGSVSWFH